jgi:hypothetical protein
MAARNVRRQPCMSTSPLTQPAIPATTKRIVIFDTNAYRQLTINLSLPDIVNLAAEIKSLESHADIFALANPIVIWELIAHLPSDTDPAYWHCMNALVMLAEHTWSLNGPSPGVCSCADPESTVSQTLFGNVPPIASLNLAELNTLAAYVNHNAPNLNSATELGRFRIFADALNAREKQWLDAMNQLLINCDPSVAQALVGGTSDKEVRKKLRNVFAGQDYFEGWSLAVVNHHAALVGWSGPQAQILAKAQLVRTVFAVPFLLMRTLAQKLPVPTPLNLAKRVNFLADYAICFSIGGSINGVPVSLITGDGDITEAAQLAGYGNQVESLSTYRTSIGLPP